MSTFPLFIAPNAAKVNNGYDSHLKKLPEWVT
jgi:hypothetical protein